MFKTLIIASDPVLSDHLSEIITKTGLNQILIINNGTEAVRHCREFKPDLIFIDIDLKGEISAIETSSLILLSNNVPVIYITHDGNDNLFTAKYSQKIIGILQKPINEAEVRTIISSAFIYRNSMKMMITDHEKNLHLLENLPDMIYRNIIANGECEYVNRTCEIITGYKPEDFYKNPSLLKSLIHPAWVEKWNNYYKDFINGKHNEPFEFQIIDKSGKTKWVLQKEVLYKNKSGKAVYVEGILSDITSQKNSEIIFTETQSKYINLIQNAPVSITRLDIKTNKYEFSNHEFKKKFGMSIDDFNNMSDEELNKLYHPEDNNRIKTEYNEWIKGGYKGVKNITYRMYNKSGELLWLDSYHYADRDHEGKPYAVNQIYVDVTDKVIYEKLLKQSEDKFRIIAESMPAQVIIYQDDKFVYANPYSEIITGYSVDELLNKNFWEIVHPDYQEMVKERGYARLKGKDVPDKYEVKIISKDGKEKWLNCSAKRILYNNKPAGFCVASDITELKKSQELLKQSEERYRTFIEQSNEGIYRVELDKPVDVNLPVEEQVNMLFSYSKIAECNLVMARMYGYEKPEDLIGKSVRELLPPEDEHNFSYVKRFVESNYNISDEESHEIDVNGNPLRFSNNAIGIVEDGKLIRIWGTQIDITERKKLEQKMKENIEYEKILNYFTSSMIQQNTVDEILNDIVINCFSHLSFTDCVIYLIDSDKKNLIKKASYGVRIPEKKVLNTRSIIPVGTGIVGNVAKTGKAMIVNDTSESDLYIPEEEVRLSEIAVPIIAKGEVIGVIDSEHAERNFFTEFHLNILQSIASLCSIKIIQALDQEKIIESEERYRTFIKNSNDGIICFEFREAIDTSADIETQLKLFNKNIYIAECNRAFAKMYDETDPSKLIGKKPEELKYVNIAPEERTIQFIINDYKFFDKETIESDKHGNLKYFSLNGTGIIKNGKLIRIWGVQKDITEKKKSDETLKRSLTEKDILLKEIHHRVKNNLQIVTSLLKLQSSYFDDENIKQLFRETQNRVQSMALIHQKLYLTRDLSHIKLHEYLTNIILHLQHSYGILEDRVKIVIDDKDISISLDNAVPCGLIINELVSNSLKYAFPDGRKGNIFIDTAYDDITGRYWLSVKDDGIGLPEDSPQRANTFGLKLVSTLVEQMDGNLEVIMGNGTEYRITFVSSEYKERGRIKYEQR